jgi:hypothetical protein
MAFNLENYQPVSERLAQAHADIPDLRIITDLVHVERDENGKPLQYIVRAQAWVGDVLKAQDFAEEIVGSSNVNRTSALENCATSAIGRALADMGYQGSDPRKTRPSREEMEKVARAENDAIAEKIQPVAYSEETISLVVEALNQIPDIESIDELKNFYAGVKGAKLENIPVNGKTVNAVIAKRKKELEKSA